VGAHGVELFFIISGYLMSLIYSRDNFRINPFIWRRIARIAPLWYFYILVWVVINLVLQTNPFIESITTWILLILIASSITTDASNSFLQGNFSISNEWLFYLTFPILRKLRSQFLLYLGIVCALFAVLLKANFGFYSGIPNQFTEREKWIGIFAIWNALPFFIFGILLQRHLCARPKVKSSTLNILGVCVIGYCLSVFALKIDSYRDIFGPLILLIFFYVHNLGKNSQILTWLGQRSYGIFFAHFLVIGGYERAIAALGHSWAPITALIQIVLVLLGSSFIAALTWKFIEKPISSTARRSQT